MRAVSPDLNPPHFGLLINLLPGCSLFAQTDYGKKLRLLLILLLIERRSLIALDFNFVFKFLEFHINLLSATLYLA